MKSIFGLIFVFVSIAGCASLHKIEDSTPPDLKPNAQGEYTTECNGANKSISSCYEQADKLCSSKGMRNSIIKVNESNSGGVASRSIVFKCTVDTSRKFPNASADTPQPAAG